MPITKDCRQLALSSLAIVGHTSHGKTTLALRLAGSSAGVRALEPNSRPSEDMRVLAMESPPSSPVVLIDVPGNPRFLKNAVSGMQGVAGAVLVVAADDGVRSQTLVHLQILELLRVRCRLVVISKADLVDEETLELARMEIEETLRGGFHADAPILAWAAPHGRGLEAIRSRIGEAASQPLPHPSSSTDFRLWIDRVWSVRGFGTVVSGPVASGSLAAGDDLVVEPGRLQTRARSVEILGKRVNCATVGQRVGVNLPGIPFPRVKRGMVLVRSETLAVGSLVNVDLRLLSDAPRGLNDRQRVRVHLGTAVTRALLVLMTGERLEPGRRMLTQLRLQRPVAAVPGDRLLIGLLERRTVIGGGTVLETPRDKFRAVKAGRTVPYLEALRDRDAAAVVRRFFARHGDRPATCDEIIRRSGFPAAELTPVIERALAAGDLVTIDCDLLFSSARLLELQGEVLETVRRIQRDHALKLTVTLEEIRDRLRLEKNLLRCVVDRLCRERQLSAGPGGYRSSGEGDELSAEQREIVRLIIGYVKRSGLGHFNADMFWRDQRMRFNKRTVEKLLEYLRNRGRLIRLHNNRYLSPEALAEIRRRVEATITEKGRLTLRDSKEILGYGRTGAVPVLEYLDALGVTCRVGDERVLASDVTVSVPSAGRGR